MVNNIYEIYDNITNITYNFRYTLYHLMIFNINISSTTIYLINGSTLGTYDTIEESVGKHESDQSIVIKLPNIQIYSTGGKTMTDLEIENFPLLITGWSDKKSLFPWSFSLTNLSCHSLLCNQIITLLEPTTTCVTLAISTKDDEKDLSVYFHIDTTPITVHFYKNQVK